MNTCSFTLKGGKRCSSPRMRRYNYCYSHNPETRDKHRESAQKGGQVTSSQSLNLLKPLDLMNSKAVIVLIADTINRVRQVDINGGLDVRTANCLGFLAGKLLEAQERLTLEQRIERLEIISRELKQN